MPAGGGVERGTPDDEGSGAVALARPCLGIKNDTRQVMQIIAEKYFFQTASTNVYYFNVTLQM